jgi:hypothetical protein
MHVLRGHGSPRAFCRCRTGPGEPSATALTARLTATSCPKPRIPFHRYAGASVLRVEHDQDQNMLRTEAQRNRAWPTATMTATATVNVRHQHPAASHHARTSLPSWEAARPENQTVGAGQAATGAATPTYRPGREPTNSRAGAPITPKSQTDSDCIMRG